MCRYNVKSKIWNYAFRDTKGLHEYTNFKPCMFLLSFFHFLLEISNYFSSANAISGPSVMSMRNGGGWGHFVYLNTKIPSGINSGTIIVAENNADCWESPEMKGAWGTHMLSADNNSFHSLFCL